MYKTPLRFAPYAPLLLIAYKNQYIHQDEEYQYRQLTLHASPLSDTSRNTLVYLLDG